ncbi:DUF4190 domain-containing protein [Corynebacterium sp.]|uniref:DUF4190 domain-containing protein n=1 Tax=Corynebacterium sp. TaxID=1720 RepID=UPI00199E93D2|nr:DUF4190 domain-containing protein [Corynebacterium sp.]HHU68109.1 DUF4190 domain-containing protein [Corynebacterium sp.]
MSNPFTPDNPRDDQSGLDRSGTPGTPPNYEAYRYPSGGAEATPSVPSAEPAYGAGYGGYSSDVGTTWAVDEEKNGVAPWALGLGILALVMGLSLVATAFAFLAGLVGLIVGVVALVRGRRINGPGRRTGMSVGGLVLSIIAIGLSIIFWVVFGVIMADSGMADCLSITDPAQRQECVERAIDTWLNQ